MKTHKFSLALIGCGDIAAYVALFAKTLPRFSISTCCAANYEDAKRFAAKYGIAQAEPDYDTLLARNNFDAVYLAIPHHLHLPFTQQALRRGYPVLCEKPIASTLYHAQEMIDTTEAVHGKVGINYQYRYDQKCWQMKQEIQSNRLGKIFQIQINVPWHRDITYFDSSPWHRQLATAGGGTLLTQGSHFLDIALWSLPNKPMYAMGKTTRRLFTSPDIEIEDLAMGIVEMSDGTLIEIVSTMTSVPGRPATITVYGERGILKYIASSLPSLRYTGIKPSRTFQPLTAHGIHALARSLRAFQFWIQGGPPYFTSIQDAFPVMAVIDAIYRSSLSGKQEGIGLGMQ
ncbi:MAG: Gfo/Idh/MocA family oxidoreductase [Anaerolineae bacterium]|nr:Gfo/Idh/MocA family oxidoreductase [Anaerolineae bacterium]